MVEVSRSDKVDFDLNGYVVARSLFSDEEVNAYIDHYMGLREADSYAGDFSGVDATDDDPLKAYPRMIHMHRWDQVSLDWMVDDRIGRWLEDLTGQPAYAVQTMLYFKPAGSRGQALHQDQFYLKAKPGTCMAAWMALDPCDEENGCLQVVPASGDLPMLCTEKADIESSFIDVTIPLPDAVASVPMIMAPGDVLFFNGSVIHGSLPNRSSERFRRSLIGHYVTGNAREVSRFYKPVLNMKGNEVDFGESEGGGPCGVWVEKDGRNEVTVSAR